MTTNLGNKAYTYNSSTLKRAKRALSCSPFCLKLFQDMRQGSVPISQITGVKGIKLGYTTQELSEPRIEAKLVWLINVGLLRREVDGQGLTDSFRLTPLGREIIAQWSTEKNQIPAPDLLERVFNWLNRWLKWSL